jgi:hypothetical protein
MNVKIFFYLSLELNLFCLDSEGSPLVTFLWRVLQHVDKILFLRSNITNCVLLIIFIKINFHWDLTKSLDFNDRVLT